MAGDEPTDDEVRRVLSALPETEPAGDHLDEAVLVAHSRGALAVEQAEEADQHLASCAACRELLIDLGVEPERAGVERAVVAMEAARARRVGRLGRWAGGLAAAAAVLVVVSTVEVGRVPGPVGEKMVHQLTGFEGVKVEMGPAGSGKERLFRPDTSVGALLRPEQSAKSPSVLSVFVSRPGMPLERVPVTGVRGATDDTPMLVVTRSDSGVFQVRGRGRHMFRSGPGQYVVSFVIAAPESRCTRMDGITLAEAQAQCVDAIDWQDVEARFEP